MGLFGGDDEPSQAEQMMEQEIRDNKAELEAKRQNLYQEKLDIIKGQGAEQWSPDRTRGAPKTGGQGNIRIGGFNFPFG